MRTVKSGSKEVFLDNLKRNALLFVVFLTGASVLIIEVVATRILSPYFGNTIFTVSSVIGVILAALSIGYYFGGKVADKYPSEKIFFLIIFISGLTVLLIEIIILTILPSVGYSLSLVSGPLISSLLLFSTPSLLLGTLSPYAIKLQEMRMPKKGIGSLSGEVFFVSTLGSIFGTLIAGFYLIPNFGINQIVITIGLLLVFIGIVGIYKSGSKTKIISFFLIVALIPSFIVTLLIYADSKSEIVYKKDGVYERITIYDTEHNGKPARLLLQDKSLSGAIYFDSDEMALDYSKYYLVYKLFFPNPKEILVIGGGAYTIPSVLVDELPEAVVDVSEIEPSLFSLSKRYFEVPETTRINNFIKDGRRMLYDSSKKYDVIFSDVFYSILSIPVQFTTIEFFELADEKLTEGGVFIANIIGDLSPQKESFMLSEIKTFKKVFPNSYFFATKDRNSDESQNVIFVGYKSDEKIDFFADEMANNENELLKNLSRRLVNTDSFDLSSHIVLTDNYAPVEMLTAKMIQER